MTEKGWFVALCTVWVFGFFIMGCVAVVDLGRIAYALYSIAEKLP